METQDAGSAKIAPRSTNQEIIRYDHDDSLAKMCFIFMCCFIELFYRQMGIEKSLPSNQGDKETNLSPIPPPLSDDESMVATVNTRNTVATSVVEQPARKWCIRSTNLNLDDEGNDQTEWISVRAISSTPTETLPPPLFELVRSMVSHGIDCALDQAEDNLVLRGRRRRLRCPVWTPEGRTSSFTLPYDHDVLERETLVWSGRFMPNNSKGPCHGDAFPLARARGIVRIRPHDLATLLNDSSRVTTYNAYSAGRTDLYVFSDSLDSRGDGAVKILSNVTKPPLINISMTMVSLFHSVPVTIIKDGCDDDDEEPAIGYVNFSRTICEPEPDSGKISSTQSSEVLVGCNVIRPIFVNYGGEDVIWSEVTSVTHVVSNLIPSFLAKRTAVKGSADFIEALKAMGKKQMNTTKTIKFK